MLKTHEDRMFPGAIVASMSTPWGNHGNTLGGYHLVWPRDAAMAAFALLASARRGRDAPSSHIDRRQQPDGRWAQNYFPNGTPYWTGIQLDETAFPILLAAKLHEAGIPTYTRCDDGREAAALIARDGPASDQDRWEENPGISAFTVAVAIAALVAAAAWLEGDARAYALDLADDWNERVEQWCYVAGTALAGETGVAGYYVRLAPPEKDGGLTGSVLLRNRNGETIPAAPSSPSISPSSVRLGLRAHNDPRVLDTMKVVDAVLKVETPSGPVYRRYNDDGYGEYDDGRAYDGNGVGRAWPLLAGERGHLALQARRGPDRVPPHHDRCASPGGMLPEQVWDTARSPSACSFPAGPPAARCRWSGRMPSS